MTNQDQAQRCLCNLVVTIQGANIKEQKEYLFQRGHTECNDKKKKDKD